MRVSFFRVATTADEKKTLAFPTPLRGDGLAAPSE